MPRVRLLGSTEDFFSRVQEKTGYTFEKLAKICKVHRRSFSDWKRGNLLMPIQVFEKLIELTGFEKPPHEIFPDHWHVREAGRKGAKRRAELYGPLGTPDGRRKGGMISSRNFMKNPSWAKDRGFIVRKKIYKSADLQKLAECIGIILGDGTIAKFQVVVTVHRIDDFEYAHYIHDLFAQVFGFTPSWVDRKKENVIAIISSRIDLVEYLLKKGMKRGNKVRQQVNVPYCIMKNKNARGACLRGLFDTDGCFYIDKHKIKGKIHFNCGMNFTNRSIPLLNFFKEELQRRGYHPTQRTRWSVFLRREKEIIRYFSEIKSSNAKHLNKFKTFIANKYGGVA